MRVVVVGAGVVGLTAALRLLEAGHSVVVVTDRPSAATTSAVAAAIWGPYRVETGARTVTWAATSYAVLTDLAARPGSGVALRFGTELARAETPVPEWAAHVPGLRPATVGELPPGYRHGLRYRAPVVDMSVHLPWLVAQVHRRGGDVVRRRLTRLEEAPAAEVVVDSAGLGARELVGDSALVPVRGQVVRVGQVGVAEWTLDEHHPDGLLYVVPRETDVVLGGTATEGAEDLRPDPAVAAAIVARCTALEPRLAGAPVREHAVGLRPTRPSVRLERGVLDDGRPVVHDYGHGGAGVTLSWGCADDVVGLVEGVG